MALSAKERKEYILNLDKVVRRWRDNSCLFGGGCCFSAGQIAKMLEKKGIRYRVVCWYRGESTDLKEIVAENNCYHIGIQVILDSKHYTIGGEFYIPSEYRYRKTYKNKVSSDKIIEYDLLGVTLKTWNHYYNRSLNNRFINVLHNAVSK